MTSFLQFAVIGLGAGACYALLAHGLVLVYRGSGVVNFAHGALAMLAAYVTLVTLRTDHGWPIVPAVVGGVAASSATAVAFQVTVLHRLRHASAIVRLVATLGMLAVVQASVVLKYGSRTVDVDPFLPRHTYRWGEVAVQQERLIVLGVALTCTGALWVFARSTRVGLAITAASRNQRAVATLGWSPERLATLTWALGGALAGLAGILVAPFTGLTPEVLTLVVTVSALAAALVGGFSSFPLTLLGGLLLGVGEAEMTHYQSDVKDLVGLQTLTGATQAVPFLVILVVLVLRGRGLPLRSHVSDSLPRLGTGVVNWRGLVLACGAVVAVLLAVMDDSWASALQITLASGVLLASIVILTGYTGQLSLAQSGVAGIGALITAQLMRIHDLPLEAAALLGICLTVPIGLTLALPALRTRGVNLAVITLGMGFTVSQVVFANPNWIGDPLEGGTKVGDIELFGVAVDAVDHPHRWALVCLAALVGVGLLVANLRRSATGRRLIAVRTNERAAASLGISVVGAKLFAFGLATAVAALAGVLLGLTSSTVTYQRFNAFASINAAAHAVIGGLGYVLALPFGAPNASGGLGTEALGDWFGLGRWDMLVGGGLLLVVLVAHPHGIADEAVRLARRPLLALRLVRPTEQNPRLEPVRPLRIPPKELRVDQLTVRFGSSEVVKDVSFSVAAGEVVGLIGPNGAGKTTIIDAVSGFVPAARGAIDLGADRISGRAANRRAALGLRRSFQSLELFEDLTVEDNVRIGADASPGRWAWVADLIHPGSPPLPAGAGLAISELGLADHLRDLPGQLSQGQRRLLALARTIAGAPSIVMLDEPAAGLDHSESIELSRIIRRLADELGIGVLLVEHDVALVMSTCDRVIVLDFGQVIAHGRPREVRADPAVLAAYLGTPAAATA